MAYDVVDIRQYDSQALGHLLDAEAQAWNHSLHWDYAASRRLIASCLDERRLAGYALRLSSELAGYSFFFYEGAKGLVGNLFVNTSDGRRGHAAILLKHVLETLLATPRLARVETQLPHFTMEELEPFFRPYRFEAYLRRFMLLTLARRTQAMYSSSATGAEGTATADPVLQRIRIVPWERQHDQGAAEVIFNAYRHHIDAHINDQYSSLAGALHLVESIVQQRGCGELIPPASLIALYEPTGKMAGALAVTGVRHRTAHIPQIAVAREFQGHGLGTALLEAAFQELSRRGYEEVSLTVTDRNGGAVRLYEHLEFETFHTFGAFTWEAR